MNRFQVTNRSERPCSGSSVRRNPARSGVFPGLSKAVPGEGLELATRPALIAKGGGQRYLRGKRVARTNHVRVTGKLRLHHLGSVNREDVSPYNGGWIAGCIAGSGSGAEGCGQLRACFYDVLGSRFPRLQWIAQTQIGPPSQCSEHKRPYGPDDFHANAPGLRRWSPKSAGHFHMIIECGPVSIPITCNLKITEQARHVKGEWGAAVEHARVDPIGGAIVRRESRQLKSFD